MAVRENVYIMPNVSGPTEAVSINENLCIGCNACANICRTQTILPSPEKGQPPVLIYPDECWFCACCVEVCPTGALEMRHPIARRLLFKRKETNEVFRIGQKNPPPKTYFKAPYGLINCPERVQYIWSRLSTGSGQLNACFTPKACQSIAEQLHDPEAPIGKVAAIASLIGFDRVTLSDSDGTSGNQPDNTTIFVTEKNSGIPKDSNTISAKEFIQLFHRACVSMFTAVQVWQNAQEKPFDPAS